MNAKVEKLDEKIAALKAERKAEKQAERARERERKAREIEQGKRAIVRAAERSGLARLSLDSEELLREFRHIVDAREAENEAGDSKATGFLRSRLGQTDKEGAQ